MPRMVVVSRGMFGDFYAWRWGG